MFASTPAPPYYAVIFTNKHSADIDGYGDTADEMVRTAPTMPGYLGVESVRDATGAAITVCYWQDEESIAGWKANALHLEAQRRGQEQWYEHYELRVAKVERAYSGPEGRPAL